VLGGQPGERSTKILRRADGSEQVLPAKCDEVHVEPGDMLVYRTAGGGGWKDRLERDVEAVARDVAFGLVSREKALSAYGVVFAGDGTVDADATAAERERQATERGPAKDFDFGPSLEETLAACEAETGLPAPSAPVAHRWSPVETAEAAMARARAASDL
jgi:N-methylhydantoinase B